MPIEVAARIEPLNQEAFHALDRRIMGEVFAIHNDFGRLLEENLYKVELAIRCEHIGLLPAQREIQVRVTHEDFTKEYFVDFLFCHGFMLEAKTAEQLVPAHRNQSLNYLMLLGLKHGRLVNFRTSRVQHEFVSTTLSLNETRRFRVEEVGWKQIGEESRLLRIKTLELLHDWGGFLDVNLYREALVHFLGGPARVGQRVEIFSGSRRLGQQHFNLLKTDTGFALTSKPGGTRAVRDQLERLLDHTDLRAIQWINLNRHVVEFTTLYRKDQYRSMRDQNHESIAPAEFGICASLDASAL